MENRPLPPEMRAVMLLTDGFEESEAIVPCDILRRGGMEVILVSLTDSLEVVGSHGITIKADKFKHSEIPPFRMEILPGGMPASQTLYDDLDVMEFLKHAALGDDIIGAICAAPAVLGRAMILDGKRATCYPGFEDKLKYATYTGARVEVDGNIITANGAGAAYEFGLALLAARMGQAKADEIRKQMMLP